MPDKEHMSDDEKFDAIIDKIDSLMEWQKHHLSDYHANLRAGEAALLVEQNRENARLVRENSNELAKRGPLFELLLEDVRGKMIIDPVTGNMIDREPSIRQLMEDLRQQGKDDVSISFTSKVSVAVITAVVSGVAVVLAALVEGFLK